MRRILTIIILICINFVLCEKTNAATNSEIREQAKILYMGNQLEAVKQSIAQIPLEERIAEDYYLIALATADRRAAIKSYYSALKLNPDFYQAYYNIGSLYLGVQNYDRAIDYLKKALSANKDSEYVHYNLGCLYLMKNDFSSARKHFETAIKLNPMEPDYYYNLAYTHKKLNNEKRAQKAIDLYNELIQKRNET